MYTNKVIDAFNIGTLQLDQSEQNTTLRAYLAEKLGCDPMRITKKYTGASCLGKRVYRSDKVIDSRDVSVEQDRRELAVLEHNFRVKLEETSRKKAAGGGRAGAQSSQLRQGTVSTPAIDALIMESHACGFSDGDVPVQLPPYINSGSASLYPYRADFSSTTADTTSTSTQQASREQYLQQLQMEADFVLQAVSAGGASSSSSVDRGADLPCSSSNSGGYGGGGGAVMPFQMYSASSTQGGFNNNNMYRGGGGGGPFQSQSSNSEDDEDEEEQHQQVKRLSSSSSPAAAAAAVHPNNSFFRPVLSQPASLISTEAAHSAAQLTAASSLMMTDPAARVISPYFHRTATAATDRSSNTVSDDLSPVGLSRQMRYQQWAQEPQIFMHSDVCHGPSQSSPSMATVTPPLSVAVEAGMRTIDGMPTFNHASTPEPAVCAERWPSAKAAASQRVVHVQDESAAANSLLGFLQQAMRHSGGCDEVNGGSEEDDRATAAALVSAYRCIADGAAVESSHASAAESRSAELGKK